MRRAKVAVLCSLILLTDFYFLHPSVRLPVIAMAFLIAAFVIRRGIPRIAIWRGKPLATLLGTAFAFTGFMAIVDLMHGVNPYDVAVQVFSQGLVVMMLPSFLDGERFFPLVRWFRRFAFVSAGFALLQASGHPVLLASLISDVGVIGSDGIVATALDGYGRATGATSNTVGFAMEMSMMALLAYAGFELGSRGRQLSIGLVGLVALAFSQTRAALYGLLPAMLISRFFFGAARFQQLVKLIPILGIALIGIWIFQLIASELLPYVAKEVDITDTYRFWTNWYMAVGVFYESPFFGIGPMQAWDIYFRYGDMYLMRYSPDMRYSPEMGDPIYHNQLGYYFRNYGFFGLAFLGLLYFRVLQAIKASESQAVRVALGAIFVLDFVYSMAHDNKLIASPLLWIMLSMAFLPAPQADAMLRMGNAR